MTQLELLRVFGDLHCVCKTRLLIVCCPTFNIVETSTRVSFYGLVDPKNVGALCGQTNYANDIELVSP